MSASQLLGAVNRVSTIEAYRVALPLVHAFTTSSHGKSSIEHILVRVQSEAGVVGWGEIASPSDPYYCSETVDTAWMVLRNYLGPALLGSGWEEPRDVPRLWARIRGHNFAKAGVEMACWDLWSTAHGLPLARALGGERTKIAAGVSLGIEPTIDDLLAEVERQVESGYARVKLKIAPGWDVEPVRAVRRRYPDLQLQVDANGAYSESSAHLDALSALDDHDLLLVEQPFAPGALVAHARLQARMSTAICLDESVEDLDHLEAAIELRAGRVLNIKVSRMGGLAAAVAAHDRAVAAGWRVWCGGMHEFGVGRAANVAVASLAGYTLPGDVSGSDKYYTQDIVDPPIRARSGMVTIPMTPGLGHHVDEELVSRLASASLSL
jgi:O-succinylbenzoate synthase